MRFWRFLRGQGIDMNPWRDATACLLLVLAGVTGLAEVLEFFVLKRMGDKYGGSRGAFWGAVLGGFAGVVVGTPIDLASLGMAEK